MPSDASLLKNEPQSRLDQGQSDAVTPKLESPTLDVKEKLREPEDEQNHDALRDEVQENREIPPHDSEDSLSPECVADELRRLTETRAQAASATPHQGSEEGATAPNSAWNWEGAAAPNSNWDWESRGPYAPQRTGRYRGRLFLPYFRHAHYIYECYLKSQMNSSRPPSGCDLSTVWSLQTNLDRDLPKACSLTMKPSL